MCWRVKFLSNSCLNAQEHLHLIVTSLLLCRAISDLRPVSAAAGTADVLIYKAKPFCPPWHPSHDGDVLAMQRSDFGIFLNPSQSSLCTSVRYIAMVWTKKPYIAEAVFYWNTLTLSEAHKEVLICHNELFVIAYHLNRELLHLNS